MASVVTSILALMIVGYLTAALVHSIHVSNRTLLKVASRDALTGLFNRRALDDLAQHADQGPGAAMRATAQTTRKETGRLQAMPGRSQGGTNEAGKMAQSRTLPPAKERTCRPRRPKLAGSPSATSWSCWPSA